jgi:hypothetical protein
MYWPAARTSDPASQSLTGGSRAGPDWRPDEWGRRGDGGPRGPSPSPSLGDCGSGLAPWQSMACLPHLLLAVFREFRAVSLPQYLRSNLSAAVSQAQSPAVSRSLPACGRPWERCPGEWGSGLHQPGRLGETGGAVPGRLGERCLGDCGSGAWETAGAVPGRLGERWSP